MMKITQLILFYLLCSYSAFGQTGEAQIPLSITPSCSDLDSTQTNNTAQYQFQFLGLQTNSNPVMITYRVNAVEYITELGIDKTIIVITNPGKHVFEFYMSETEHLLTTDTLVIKNQYISKYILSSTEIMYVQPIDKTILLINPSVITPTVDKPVIYLYPETDTDVEVKINIKGEHPFLYPAYNDGWKCQASPNGDLTFGDEVYNYLFWESNQFDHLQTTNLDEGFMVEGMDAVSFLEDKLSQAGFTSKEKADFITFWGPLIQKNTLNFVRFEFNETCDKFAELNISPKPDHVFRMYIFFSPINEKFEVTEQKIERINREGFTVLEWGGQKSLPLKMIEIN